jgi:uncharacterized repeat protein (TIGR03803 family)
LSNLNWPTKACGIILLWTATAIALPAQTFTTIHVFEGMDGDQPESRLAQGTDGNLYGTTISGGTKGIYQFGGYGVVFALSTSGSFTTVHDFDGADGYYSLGALFQASNGDF